MFFCFASLSSSRILLVEWFWTRVLAEQTHLKFVQGGKPRTVVDLSFKSLSPRGSKGRIESHQDAFGGSLRSVLS
eukprot:6022432-Amphidinium_carterae.1